MLPAAGTVGPVVDAYEIADVEVAVLTGTGQRNRLYELTGPRALTFTQCIEDIAEALGRPVKYTAVPIDDYIGALDEQGVPAELQWLLRELFTVVFDGRNSNVMPGVEQALNRPATDFKDYVRKTIETGVWNTDTQRESA